MSKVAELKEGVLASYGKHWDYMEDGRIKRDGEHVATYDAGTKVLTWNYLALGTQYNAPVMRLLKGAARENPSQVTYEGAGPKIEGSEGGSIPPRPEQHLDWGEHTPSLVRWREKFAPEEFQLYYEVPDMDPLTRVDMPVMRKEIYPDYRRKYAEDQPGPDSRIIKYKGEEYAIPPHEKGAYIEPHLWRAYGDEVVETAKKYAGKVDTVLTYKKKGVATGEEELTRDVPADIRY